MKTLRFVFLFVTLAGFLTLNYGFTNWVVLVFGLRIPVGHVLAFAALLLALPGNWKKAMLFLKEPVVLAFIALALLSLGHLVFDLKKYGGYAARDASFLVESAFLLLGFLWAQNDKDRRLFLRGLLGVFLVTFFYSLTRVRVDLMMAVSPVSGVFQRVPIFGTYMFIAFPLQVGALFFILVAPHMTRWPISSLWVLAILQIGWMFYFQHRFTYLTLLVIALLALILEGIRRAWHICVLHLTGFVTLIIFFAALNFWGEKVMDKNSEVPVMGKNSEVPVMGKNSEVPVMGKNDKVPVMGKNDKVPVMGKNDKVPVMGKNSEVPVMGKNDKVPVMGKNSEVPVMGKNDKVPVMGRQNEVTVSFYIKQIETFNPKINASNVTSTDWRLQIAREAIGHWLATPATIVVGEGFGRALTSKVIPGVSLADTPQTLYVAVRQPHNIHITILARLGLVGLAIWIYIQARFFFLFVRSLRKKKKDSFERALTLWLFLFFISGIIVASFHPWIEFPVGAIPFFIVLGFALAFISPHFEKTAEKEVNEVCNSLPEQH